MLLPATATTSREAIKDLLELAPETARVERDSRQLGLPAGHDVRPDLRLVVSLALSLWLPWWFAVPMRGSLVLFFGLSALFLFSSLGLGLVIGVIAQNLQQALLLSFFTIFPVMVISGGFVPVESMPRAIQHLSLLSPLRHYMEIALGIFLKGVGLDVLWRPATLMTILGLAVFGFGLSRFRQQLA
jgi:ABC-2 type transport system permease protein